MSFKKTEKHDIKIIHINTMSCESTLTIDTIKLNEFDSTIEDIQIILNNKSNENNNDNNNDNNTTVGDEKVKNKQLKTVLELDADSDSISTSSSELSQSSVLLIFFDDSYITDHLEVSGL